MISKNAKYFCSEDVSNIENYEEAVNSPEKWHCHHRLELDENGHRLNTREELKEKGLYFNRPASELIFLKATDHLKLHMSDEQKERISNVQLKLWKKPSRKRKVRDKFANKRENGEFLTNIEQMRSDEDYREYQKQYKHIWYTTLALFAFLYGGDSPNLKSLKCHLCDATHIYIPSVDSSEISTHMSKAQLN